MIKGRKWTKSELEYVVKVITSGTEGERISDCPSTELAVWLTRFWGISDINKDYFSEAFCDGNSDALRQLDGWELWEMAGWETDEYDQVVRECLGLPGQVKPRRKAYIVIGYASSKNVDWPEDWEVNVLCDSIVVQQDDIVETRRPMVVKVVADETDMWFSMRQVIHDFELYEADEKF
jgi:hypothetical protein